MNPMLPEVPIQMNPTVFNLHSKHGHPFNFAEFFTGSVKSDLCLDTDGKLLCNYSTKHHWSDSMNLLNQNLAYEISDCLSQLSEYD